MRALSAPLQAATSAGHDAAPVDFVPEYDYVRASTAVGDLERLDSVVHDFLGCLNQRDSQVVAAPARSADIERFVRILEYVPPMGGPVLGPPVLCGMSPPVELWSLFGFLGSMHKTGILRIHTDDTIFMISIVEGDVVHGVSQWRPEAELLGNLLVSLGSIDRVSLGNFFRKCGPSASRIAEALSREELVNTAELRRALEIQLRQLFDRLLAARNAEWCFHEGEATLSYIHLRVNAIGVLLDSARKRDERKRS